MSSESDGVEKKTIDDSQQENTKQEHIKQRLKDLGVSDDSQRPKKSWFSRFGNHIMITAVVVLSVLYWLEYRSMEQNTEVEVSEVTQDTDMNDGSNNNTTPYTTYNPYPVQNPYANQIAQPRVDNPRVDNSSVEKTSVAEPEWSQKQAKYQEEMQKAWKEQSLRYQKWQEKQRENQAKAWEAWQNYIKQQQALNDEYMRSNGINTGHSQQMQNRNNFRSYPPQQNNRNYTNNSMGYGYAPNQPAYGNHGASNYQQQYRYNPYYR